MAAHKTNPFLKWALIPIAALLLVIVLLTAVRHARSSDDTKLLFGRSIKNSASKDSAKESLDTLTAELGETQQQVKSVMKANDDLKTQNQSLLAELQGKKDQTTQKLSQELSSLKTQVQTLNTHPAASEHAQAQTFAAEPITNVPEVAVALAAKNPAKNAAASHSDITNVEAKKPEAIPFYTIPANATAVEDRLMTALVGRIPVKGVVTDPYPFKIVFSDNTLAANGLRVPNLRQMIVSGYTEGDLNLVSVRGWVTSLTFVFNDGTISTTTSNDNNIGKFSKDDALGYLSDKYGNPFIRGKLITNAPAYLATSVALGAAQGAANAYSQSQTTSDSTIVGTSTSSVTGSSSAYVAGQAMSNATSQVQQWWHDREEQSFDAVYVPTVDEKMHEPVFIAVNFSKEIKIDYDPKGRRLVYTQGGNNPIQANLD